MRAIQEYREHAVECRRLAGRARSPEERDTIIRMAEIWDSLAEGRQKMLRQRANIENVEQGCGQDCG